MPACMSAMKKFSDSSGQMICGGDMLAACFHLELQIAGSSFLIGCRFPEDVLM
jgi:hypothetical protein